MVQQKSTMINVNSAKFLPFAITLLCLSLKTSAADDHREPTMNGRCDRNFCACAKTRTHTGFEDVDGQLAMECPDWMSDAYQLGHFSDVRRTYCHASFQDVEKEEEELRQTAMVGEDVVLCLGYTKYFFDEEPPQPPHIGTTIMGNTTCHDLNEYFPNFASGTVRVSTWKLQDGPDKLLIDYFNLWGTNEATLPSNATGADDFRLEGLGNDPIPICPDDPPAGVPTPASGTCGAAASLVGMILMVLPFWLL